MARQMLLSKCQKAIIPKKLRSMNITDKEVQSNEKLREKNSTNPSE
jgi:hypothetical protein